MLTGTSYSSYTNINQFMTHIERGVLMAQMFNDIEIIQTITQELTFDEQQLFEQQVHFFNDIKNSRNRTDYSGMEIVEEDKKFHNFKTLISWVNDDCINIVLNKTQEMAKNLAEQCLK